MRVTKIRYNKTNGGGKLTERFLEALCLEVKRRMTKEGFITDVSVLTSTSIRIGLHMSSFRIDTARLGHNARTNRHCRSPKGYKRTNVPTWDQRVEFNNIVNDVLDIANLDANIVSGNYTVRRFDTGRVDNWYQGGDRGGYAYNADANGEILSEQDMRDSLDSDRLEREHREATCAARLQKAQDYRERIKLFNQAKRVTVAGFYESYVKPRFKKNGKQLTHHQFNQLLLKNTYGVRRIRAASIHATVAAMVRPKLSLVQGGAA